MKKGESKYLILEYILRQEELPTQSKISKDLNFEREWVRQAMI